MKNFAFKSAVTLCFCMGMYWCGSLIPLAGASGREGSKHISIGRILEFSLRNLKESLQKTKQKNDQLVFENAALRRDIQKLKRMLRDLSLKKEELIGRSSSLFEQKNKIFFTKTSDRKEREKRIRDLTLIFERDVLALQEEIQLLDSQLDQNRFNSQKQLLLGEEKEGQEYISKAEKKVKSLNKKSRGPKKTIKTLESAKNALEKKLTILQERNTFY